MLAASKNWWKEAVFYHIYLRSFADSDGDGLGDIPGLIDKLDYLTTLGIDAIWISPCYPSPDKDFGYDVADYCEIDKRYGKMEDFENLLQAAHARDIRVMMDLVFNHSSDQHPWFLESKRSRKNEKSDWYLWRDPSPAGRRPNNWQSIFGGPAWVWDSDRQQYYYHMFLKEQPDLNWRNPQVYQAMMGVVRFWLEKGVDGFRLDVFNLWFKHPEFPDNPRIGFFKDLTSRYFGLRAYERQEHLYDMDQPEMFPALKDFRHILDSYSASTSVGELFGGTPQMAAGYCGDDKLHMVFNFAFTKCRWDPGAFQSAITEWEHVLENNGWPCYVLSNHDGPRRHVSRYGGRFPDRIAKVAAAMLLTLRGTPFLYYGEEIGMPDVPLRRSQLLDPISRKYWPIESRDQGRTPMQWDHSENAGFTTGIPWLPVHKSFKTRNVADQMADPDSVFNFYRKLLRLRKSSPTLRLGNFTPLQESSDNALTYLRSDVSGDVLVGLNFRNKPVQVRFDTELPAKSWTLALSTHPRDEGKISVNSLHLKPLEALILLAE